MDKEKKWNKKVARVYIIWYNVIGNIKFNGGTKNEVHGKFSGRRNRETAGGSNGRRTGSAGSESSGVTQGEESSE